MCARSSSPYKNFAVVSFEACMMLVMSLPRYSPCLYLKTVFLRLAGARVGKRVVIYPGVWITPGRNLVLGNDVDLAKDVIITTAGGVYIGDRTLVGYRTQILSANHRIPRIGEPFPVSGDDYRPVTVHHDVWIGAGCILLPGVTVNEGAVVAAGSVVTKEVPANAVVAGVPAKVVRMRDV